MHAFWFLIIQNTIGICAQLTHQCPLLVNDPIKLRAVLSRIGKFETFSAEKDALTIQIQLFTSAATVWVCTEEPVTHPAVITRSGNNWESRELGL